MPGALRPAWTLLEAALVTAVPWPMAAILRQRQTRIHGLSLRPYRLTLAAAVAWSVTALLLVALPPMLHAMAAMALAGLAAWWWRQRPAYGAGRGLPPGALRPYQPALWRDHLALWHQARRHGPVFKLQPALEPFVCVADLEQGRSLLRQHGAALASRAWPATAEVPGGFLRILRDDAHRTVRRPVAAAMRGDLVALNEPALRAIARTGLARLAEPDPVAQRVALRDTAEAWLALTLFGIAAHDPILPQLRASLPAPEAADRTPDVANCRRGAIATGMALLRAQEFHPVTVNCVAGRIAAGSGAPPDDAVLGNLFMMVQIGAFDLSSLLRWLLHYLAHHPDVLARLRAADPAGRTALARACVQETLRLDQAEALMRTATAEIAFAGCTIPKGWGVRICLREPHRDPARFDRPHAFDPDRFLANPPPAAAYAPFGLGAHACVAAEPVVELGRLLVEELAAGFVVEIAADGPRVLGPYHWEPSPAFAVRLRPTPPARAGRWAGPGAGG